MIERPTSNIITDQGAIEAANAACSDLAAVLLSTPAPPNADERVLELARVPERMLRETLDLIDGANAKASITRYSLYRIL